MPTITRAQARTNELALLRLAAGPTRREAGSRRLRHSATDAAVYAGLVSFLNWQSGLCCPGYRHLAARSGVRRSTITDCIRRLVAAGYVRVKRVPVRVRGHGLRWRHRYSLAPVPRPEIAPKPVFRKDLGLKRPAPAEPTRSVADQLAFVARWVAEEGRHAIRGYGARDPDLTPAENSRFGGAFAW